MKNNIIMKLENVSKDYKLNGSYVHALRSVNLEIYSGEVIILMGPSGAGKTTLLSIMGFLLSPNSGIIHFQNDRFNGNANKEGLTKIRRNQIGFIFQSFNLIKSLTVLENVELVLKFSKINKSEATKRSEDILEFLNLGHRLNFKPKQLSGGEKQRVSIARALVKDPLLLLADEPTGNLDSENGRIIGEYFQQIAKEKKKAILIATHDNRLEFCADKVINIEDGILKSN